MRYTIKRLIAKIKKHCFYGVFGSPLIIVPTTSVKPSTCANEDYEMEIEQSDGEICLLDFGEIRAIDLMRVVFKKSYIDVKTDRPKIMQKFFEIYQK